MTQEKVSYELFRFTKSENKNYVVYEVVMKKDDPTKMDTVHGYWVLGQTDGSIEELNWFEKKFGYGIQIDKVEEDKITFHCVAIKYFVLICEKAGDKYQCRTEIDGVQAYISSIYIDVTTVILIKPVIHSITVTGHAVDDGREVKQVIVPNKK
ncbi:hypothetical protein TVAG_314960 [Trichomonas vaginalis G3]|uniref:DUF4833 domain-containing protein n=1 Tax=Trichomonas vaginalis (strain ATCC PRA-98 / G3) TaxID=412133 RepID=A2ETT5_TRIV3|nr:protein of unknown function (DUF4833) family [Trichomonas vaginalis G3]EAY03966.1 hypothetical protein TVAG_314960 [Trichomonas vaginalis G3]KAI5541016.1 protein of unknown function (DUF4833) family [Trichomonas vaginalis G3]|eukprot:XP_001316189.1 hypothetical protein [Trichomonas vaginalis G3]